MSQNLILFPVIALAIWTQLMLLFIPIRRFGAARKRLVTAEDFRYGESERVPPEVSIANRHLMNLLEMPLLFYVGCLCFYATQQASALAVGLAWGYVALRLVHSVIHLGYNKVEHRLIAYALSNVVLTTLWIVLLLALA